MKAPRALALEILHRIQSRNIYPHISLDTILKREPHLTRLDRAFITDLIYGVLRWRDRIDWVIGQFSKYELDQMEPTLLNILRLGVYQLLFLTKVPDSAAVNESVNLAKSSQPPWVVPFVNGLLRTIARGRESISYPDPETDLVGHISIFHSHPQWMVKSWLEEFGEKETIALCKANNQIPPLTIRTNTLKISREHLLEVMNKDIAFVSPTKYSPEGLVLRDIPFSISELKAYKNGWFYVQDEASQLVTRILDPKPHQKILDACAGLGGKTTHLAQLMDDKGEIWAWDTNKRRLSMLKGSLNRLGIHTIGVEVRDALTPLRGSERETYHGILIDAPCTGLGTIRRNPDIKWKKRPEDSIRLKSLQVHMLKNLTPLLKKNGIMVYCTCTTSREENKEVMDSFLSDFPNLTVEDIASVLGDACKTLISPSGFFQTYPHHHDMDGFFAARLRKIG